MPEARASEKVLAKPGKRKVLPEAGQEKSGRDRVEFRHDGRLTCGVWSDLLDEEVAARMQSRRYRHPPPRHLGRRSRHLGREGSNAPSSAAVPRESAKPRSKRKNPCEQTREYEH